MKDGIYSLWLVAFGGNCNTSLTNGKKGVDSKAVVILFGPAT